MADTLSELLRARLLLRRLTHHRTPGLEASQIPNQYGHLTVSSPQPRRVGGHGGALSHTLQAVCILLMRLLYVSCI
jgi:hypothetical protein